MTYDIPLTDNTPAQVRRRPRCVARSQRGFTLLELMLALALTAVVLVLVNTAVDLHLRSLDLRRNQLEEAQLVRSLLRIMADDLRAVVPNYTQDVSSIEAMLQQAAAAAAAQVAPSTGQTGNATGPSAPNGQSSDAGGDSSYSTTDQPGQSAGYSTAGASSTPNLSGSEIAGGSSPETDASGANASQASGDLSEVTMPQLPGIYGNQYQLQIDISRLPRVEDYQRYLTEDSLTSFADVPSDVKTVTYYVKSTPAVSLGNLPSGASELAALSDPSANASGLVRRELDRAVTTSALETGNVTGLENSGELIAPEVTAIEYRYFDGMEWRLEWDTSVEQQLPYAVQIQLAIRTVGSNRSATGSAVNGTAENVRIYSMVVNIPAGGGASTVAGASSSSSGSTSGAMP